MQAIFRKLKDSVQLVIFQADRYQNLATESKESPGP